MLGRTADGVFWMFRLIERSENTARLLEAGLRMSLTRSAGQANEWQSVIDTAGASELFQKQHDEYTGENVTDFLLREKQNPSSIKSAVSSARANARAVRTALTREVWEAVNESWIVLEEALAEPVRAAALPETLELVRRQSSMIRGALHGTMLRNDIYRFAQLGIYLERADNTARILDVKYYVLLPSIAQVGSSLDNMQWESILRSLSAHRSYRWVYDADYHPGKIADMLILNKVVPRSLAFCYARIQECLESLASTYSERCDCCEHTALMISKLDHHTIESIFEEALHDFLQSFLSDNSQLAKMIQRTYRFAE